MGKSYCNLIQIYFSYFLFLVISFSHFPALFTPLERYNCCVFWPVNGCFACRLLVEIIFLKFKQVFPSQTGIKKKELLKLSKNTHKKGVSQYLGATLKCWLTPKLWLTPGKNVLFIKDKSFYMKKGFTGPGLEPH